MDLVSYFVNLASHLRSLSTSHLVSHLVSRLVSHLASYFVVLVNLVRAIRVVSLRVVKFEEYYEEYVKED